MTTYRIMRIEDGEPTTLHSKGLSIDDVKSIADGLDYDVPRLMKSIAKRGSALIDDDLGEMLITEEQI